MLKKYYKNYNFFIPVKYLPAALWYQRKKTAIIFFPMMAVTYSILSYLIFISENDF